MAHILVIDDTRNIRNMVRLTLQKAGHEVETADDGAQGLASFGDGASWDLVLVDQQMPNLQGDEFVVEARRRDPAARIVMMTAFATVELAGEVIAAGAVDFLRKPFSTELLRGAVKKALERPKLDDGEFSAPDRRSGTMPKITHSINGFDYWVVTAGPVAAWPPGVEIGRDYFVRDSGGATNRCIVGVTPHVCEQIRQETGRIFAATEFVWDKMCELALSHFLFDKAEMPPSLLPIFELTGTQLQVVRQLAGMKPFLDY